MTAGLSPRLAAILVALPLRRGMRILEIGCDPGALARAIAAKLGDGHVLAIDRSPKAVAQAKLVSKSQIAAASGWRRSRHSRLRRAKSVLTLRSPSASVRSMVVILKSASPLCSASLKL